ncbi:hypothetical protein ACFWVM_29440 [Nocardia fluminea]|uniref:hypothetical protein n=1 Tax=Nocardia fluminea TaxID=134984 RepID=UPI003645FB0C
MKVSIPDDFPHGPAYLPLSPAQLVMLIKGWMYLSRHNVAALPVQIWESLGSENDRKMLLERSVVHRVPGDEQVQLPGAGRVARSRAVAVTSDPRFDSWWQAWPRKQARRDAERAFATALTKVGFAELMRATVAFAEDPNREDRFTPYGATWLNGERWHDAPLPDRNPNRRTAERGFADALDIGRQLMAEMSPEAAPMPAITYRVETL